MPSPSRWVRSALVMRDSDRSPTIFADVCFEATPAPEIGARVAALQALGWLVGPNSLRGIVRLYKENVPELPTRNEVEREIRGVMGEWYVDIADLAAPGSSMRQDRERGGPPVVTDPGVLEAIREGQLQTMPESVEMPEYSEDSNQIELPPSDETKPAP